MNTHEKPLSDQIQDLETVNSNLLSKLLLTKKTLEEIEKFGHSHGHGCGYTCANKAKECLNKLNEN